MATGESVMAIAGVVMERVGAAAAAVGLDGGSWGVGEAMVGGSVRVAAMLLLLTGVVLAMPRASAATRHAVWRAGFVLALLLPVVAMALPWRLELLPERRAVVEAMPAAPGTMTLGAASPAVAAEGSRRQPTTSQAGASHAAAAGPDAAAPQYGQSAEPPAFAEMASAAPRLGGLDGSRILLIAWLTGALLLGVRLLIGHGTVRRIVRDGRRLTGSEWTSPLYEAADILDVAVDVDLVASDRVTMPFTAGLLRPAIVLPESAVGWGGERRRAVLMHELAHVRRRDLFAHHVARWVCALHWFNPLAWAGARRMRAESERAADDLVLNAGTRASDYADHLLQIVSAAGFGHMPAPALPLAQRREFEGRMLAILEPGMRRRGPGRVQSLAVSGLVLVMTLPLAAVGRAETPLPAESPLDSPEGFVATDASTYDADESPTFYADHRSTFYADHDSDDEATDALDMPESDDAIRHQRKPPRGTQKHGFLGSLIGDALGLALPIAGQAVREGAQALEQTLADADIDVRHTAVAALAEMDDPRAVQALIRILRGDAVAEVRAAAAFALGELEDPLAVPALAEALRSDGSAEVRKHAAWALGEIEDARAVDALGVALGDTDAEVRHTAMWALGEIESPAAVPALIAALASDDAELRGMAAWALGEIESAEAVAALGRLVRDPSPDVRAAVVHALAEIEDPASAPALTAALTDDAHEVRARAAFALGELSLDVAPAALIQALADPHPDVRAAAAHALSEIGDPAAIDALTAALQDADDDVRMAAIHALLDMDGDATTDVLLELLEHEDPQIRKHAAEALGSN